MSTLLLSKEEQGIVVFHIWKSLKYTTRLTLSILLIIVGFLLQIFAMGTYNETRLIMLGLLILFLGNLLLLVKGYNNKIKLDSFSASNEWVKTDKTRLDEILLINQKSKKWDISSFDITNAAGIAVFIVVLVILIVLGVSLSSSLAGLIIALNGLVLFFPHWVTGVRRITTTPKLVKKIRVYNDLMDRFKADLSDHDVDFLVFVKGNEEKIPRDVKMKLKFKNQPEDFLGMYAQISMNDVNGTQYPYFYIVLVAKRDSNMLKEYADKALIPERVVMEYKVEGDAEILVLRQYTSKTSGYHTKHNAIVKIFDAGLRNCQKLFG